MLPGCDTEPGVATAPSTLRTEPSGPGGGAPASRTFLVRSGNEGLPALAGATIRVGGRLAATDAWGVATVDEMADGDRYLVEAPGHIAYGAVPRSATEVDVVLWPLSDGVDSSWIQLTSYYGPDYDQTLWRPTTDVVLSLEGALRQAPYRAVWDRAVAEVQHAIHGSGLSAPTIRIGLDEPGAVPVVLQEAPGCVPVVWTVTDFALRPPPRVALSAGTRAAAPETALDVVAGLAGFNLGLGRRRAPVGSVGTLSPAERTALRMRVLRPPGALFENGVEHVPTDHLQVAAMMHSCR